MQHTDKAIAEFEAWWDRQPHREQFEDVKDQMRNVWLASWAESRAQLVVTLPEAYRHDEDGYWLIGRTEAKRAIEAAGVTVRGVSMSLWQSFKRLPEPEQKRQFEILACSDMQRIRMEVWIEEEGERTNVCVKNVLGKRCSYCACRELEW